MSFFNKINNNTIVHTLKQFCNRRDCKIFRTNVPQTDTFDQDVSTETTRFASLAGVNSQYTSSDWLSDCGFQSNVRLYHDYTGLK